jgi:hypothetical protein
MTITVHQRPLQETRTANKSCKWVAEAIVSGRTYTATSRMAPANDIPYQGRAEIGRTMNCRVTEGQMPANRLWQPDAIERELEQTGLLPTSECPAEYRPLSEGGYVLLLRLGRALNQQTLRALVACSDRVAVTEKGVAALASDPSDVLTASIAWDKR